MFVTMTNNEVLFILIALTAIVFWICDTIKYLSGGSAFLHIPCTFDF